MTEGSPVPPSRVRRLTRSPQLIAQGFRLVRRAGTRLPLTFAAIDLLSGVALAVELLLIRRIGEQLVDDVGQDRIAVGALVAFGLVTAGRRTLASVASQLRVLASERVEWSLTRDVIERAAVAPYEEFEQPGFQDRLARALRSAEGQAWNTVYYVLAVSSGLVAMVSLVAVLVALAPELLAAFVVGAAVLLGVAVLQGRMQYEFTYADTPAERERRYLREALTSTVEGKEIRLFGSRRLLLDRHERLFARRVAELTRVVKRRLVADTVGHLALAAVLVGVLVLIARRAEDGALALADAAVAALAAQQLSGRLQTLMSTIGSLYESTLYLHDLTSFIGTARTTATDPNPPEGVRPALVLDNVSYTYPDTATPAVRGVSLRVEPGEIVALVGENGSGKSTLAKLAAGLYQPTAGSVRLDGGGTASSGEPLTGLVSAVFQDFARYDLTVRENVWLGAPWRGDDTAAIQAALEDAGAAETMHRLPEGLDARLGRRFEGGLGLSIGQWQRLALARAFFSPAPLLVLDEPTAAMDPKVEADLFDRIRELCAGRGVLLVSHRFSTVRSADRIVVLDEGQVVEEGTHGALMARHGVYAALYETQAERYR